MSNPFADILAAFNNLAPNYDERNSRLAPILGGLHFLMSLSLKELPVKSRVLCVGAGTGAEILALGRVFPGWTFVASDPAAGMLDVARERVKAAGMESRCEFVQGYVQDLPERAEFDAVFSLLVGHFVKLSDRPAFLGGMTKRLKSGGTLVNAEISFDLDSREFPAMLENWSAVQEMMGATPESLASLAKMLREGLTVLPPAKVGELLRESGIETPACFFQAFMIHAWSGTKT